MELKGKISTIIWDWNGTLLNDVDICISCINRLLSDRNKPPLDLPRYREIFTFPVKEYYVRAGFDFSEEPFEVPAHQFIQLYREEVARAGLQEGTYEILGHFKKSGYRQAVLSAMEKAFLLETMRNKGIEHFFSHIYGIDNHLAEGKTSIARHLLDTLEQRSEGVVLVGDTLHDHEVASDLGIECVLVSHGHQSSERLKATGRRVVQDLEELSHLIGWE